MIYQKLFGALILLVFVLLFFHPSMPKTATDVMPDEFTFYNIGFEDLMDKASSKLKENGFECGSAKSTFLGIRDIGENKSVLKSSDKIRAMMTMDKVLEEFGKNLEFEEMPIDILMCSPQEESPFNDSMYFFSGFDHTIMAIKVDIKKLNLVREKLESKFGSCIAEGYCEVGNSILLLNKKSRWPFQVFFYNNLKSHHDKIKKKKAMNDKMIEEKLNEAF